MLDLTGMMRCNALVLTYYCHDVVHIDSLISYVYYTTCFFGENLKLKVVPMPSLLSSESVPCN
jgi:hypothetical protein